MAQTATEWLFETMAKTPMTDWYNVREQAKAMEKEQIVNAFYDSELHNTGNENDGEIYYNYIYDRATDTN